MKDRKNVEKACDDPTMYTQKMMQPTNTQHKGFGKNKLNKYWRVVQWVKSLDETPMIGFTPALACVRESVKTRVMGMRSLISCMT